MTPLFVTGHGAVTALGLDAPRTIASLRAGLDGLIELPLAGVSENDLRAVPVRGYAEGVMGTARLEALAHRALAECLPALQIEEPQMPAVFLGLPSATRHGLDRDFPQTIARGLERRLGFPAGTVRPIPEGRTSVFTALQQAESWLRSAPRAAIVGAVDSLLHPEELRALSACGALAEEYDGFFPGEAAAFVCVSRRRTTGPLGRRAAAVRGVAATVESADGSANAPLVGVGLAAALRGALGAAGLSEGKLRLYINSVNGTRAEFEDDAMARIRLMRTSPETSLDVWHLASFLGETGAAYGALAVLWTSAALELGIEPHAVALVTATEGPRRGAIVLEHAPATAGEHSAGPNVGLAEAAFHEMFPIRPTTELADDPGIRLRDHDDRHKRLAADNLDALAAMIFIRDAHLRSSSPWTDIAPFERRALAHADAVAWSGEPAKRTLAHYLEGESEEAAAAALVLLCMPATADDVKLLLAACARSPEHRGRIVGVAAVSPRNIAEPLLRRLAETDERNLQDVLWALTIGRWLSPEWVEAAAPRLQRVTPDLVVALASMSNPHASPKSIGKVLAADLLPGEAALAAAFLHTPTAWLARFHAEQAIEVAPEALAITYVQAKRSLVPVLKALPAGRGVMIALGWSGEVAGIPVLLDGLQNEDEDVAMEAVRSLARISGLRPLEDAVDQPTPGEEASESGPPRKVSRLSRDRAQWEQALRPFLKAAAEQRFRQGAPWSRDSALRMLLDPKTGVSERAVALWENALCTHQPPPTHPRQWVGTQRRLLGA